MAAGAKAAAEAKAAAWAKAALEAETAAWAKAAAEAKAAAWAEAAAEAKTAAWAEAAGLRVIMDRCPKVELTRLGLAPEEEPQTEDGQGEG